MEQNTTKADLKVVWDLLYNILPFEDQAAAIAVENACDADETLSIYGWDLRMFLGYLDISEGLQTGCSELLKGYSMAQIKSGIATIGTYYNMSALMVLKYWVAKEFIPVFHEGRIHSLRTMNSEVVFAPEEINYLHYGD